MSEHDWQSLAGVLPDRNLPIETAVGSCGR